MLIIENFLAGIEWPGPYNNLDPDNHHIEDGLALVLYNHLVRHGNDIFDTYGMWKGLDGLQLFNCLLTHFTQKEDYVRCKWLKLRKEQYIRLVGYFDRCRREKVERVKKKRGVG